MLKRHLTTAGANQPVHWFFEGKGLGIQQGMRVYGLDRPNLWLHELWYKKKIFIIILFYYFIKFIKFIVEI
jgi:hypothetical protein